jgi:cellulose biosynthesis protein BcsQ
VFEAADALLVPLVPATLSARTLYQLEQVVGEQAQVLVFFSMVDARKSLHREVMDTLRAGDTNVLRTAVPSSADVERMGSRRTVLEEYAPRGRAAQAYRELWQEVRERLDAALAA